MTLTASNDMGEAMQRRHGFSCSRRLSPVRHHFPHSIHWLAESMREFSNASFSPETIAIMKKALESAVATLPEPASTVHVQSLAKTILRTTKEGERNPATLQRIALMQLQIMPRD